MVGMRGVFSDKLKTFVYLEIFMNECAIHQNSTYPIKFDESQFPQPLYIQLSDTGHYGTSTYDESGNFLDSTFPFYLDFSRLT